MDAILRSFLSRAGGMAWAPHTPIPSMNASARAFNNACCPGVVAAHKLASSAKLGMRMEMLTLPPSRNRATTGTPASGWLTALTLFIT